MKHKAKFLIFTAVFSIFYVVLFTSTHSAVNSSQTDFTFDKSGDSGGTSYAVLVPDYPNFQAWRATVGWSVEGHGSFGSGGKYGIDMCLSDNGMMWGGRPCTNVCNSDTCGNIGDGHGANPGVSYDVGSDSISDLRYAVVALYANDATFEGPSGSYPWGSYVKVEGRQVTIDSFTTSASTIGTSNTVDVNWRTNETENSSTAEVFSYSGPVNCDIGASPRFNVGGTNRGTTCTPTGPGTAVFTLEATGYNGQSGPRPKTISQTRTVNILAPSGSVVFTVTDGCSSGDIAGDATITLTGVGTQIATDAGSYHSTTFTGVANGTYNWSSSVTGYNTVSGTVTVNNGAVVGVTQTRTCGPGPAAPTCSSAGPDGDAFLVSVGTVRRYAYGVANATSVTFPSWSNTSGQDDLVWHAGTNMGGGTWYADIPLASHSPANSTGDLMNVHVYLYNASYSGIWCDTANFTTTAPTTPSITNVTINTPNVFANSSSQYTITVTATDSSGGGNIIAEYALINGPGSTYDGQYRGFITWGTAGDLWWPGTKDLKLCAGGGYASIQNLGANSVYGHDYLNLISCSTSVSGNTRTSSFVVTFNPLFATNGPLASNDIDGYAVNSFNNIDGWDNYQTNFNILIPPTASSITVSPNPILNNNSTNHTVSFTANDSTSGSNITHMYSLINYDGNDNGSGGHSPSEYRGFLIWYYDGSYTGWDTEKNKMACAGGGIAAIAQNGTNSIYGHDYLNLVSCSTTVSGTSRTVNYVVRFNPSFVSPHINNDISGWVCSPYPNCPAWHRFDTDFSLAPPTLGGVTISQPVINPDNTTQYDITISASSGGGSPVTHAYTLINYNVNSNGADGHTPADFRGFMGWYTDSAYTGWDTEKDKRSCAGGGLAAIFQNGVNSIYGHNYLTLDSCSTSVSGSTRSVVFRVRFNSSFIAPTSNNDISGWACSTYPNCVDWQRSDTNFSLLGAIVPTAPTITGTASYINTNYPFNFTSTDPGGNQIRYAVDWDSNGVADEWLPSSGYVNSGVTRTGSYSWSTAGSQTFQARAQNSLGTDSPWTQHNVNPANNPTPGACGAAATSYASTDSAYSGSYCSVGTAFNCSIGSDPNCTFPAVGSSATWQCSGLNGGADSGICTATRSAATHLVNINVNNISGGTVVSSAPFAGIINCGITCSASIPQGSTIILTAAPSSSYWQFNGWGDDCASFGRSRVCTLLVNSPKTVSASFTPRIFNYSEF